MYDVSLRSMCAFKYKYLNTKTAYISYVIIERTTIFFAVTNTMCVCMNQ